MGGRGVNASVFVEAAISIFPGSISFSRSGLSAGLCFGRHCCSLLTFAIFSCSSLFFLGAESCVCRVCASRTHRLGQKSPVKAEGNGV